MTVLPTTSTELKITNLSKSYGNIKALKPASLTLKLGITALVGPNGCGKSTLMGLLTDTLGRDEGQILFGQIDILDLGKQYRSQLGYLPQDCTVDPEMSAYAFLWYIGKLKGIHSTELQKQIAKWLELLNLEVVSKRLAGKLSGGQKQRLLVAQAMLGEPTILLLDEPMSGLDPEERLRFVNTLQLLAERSIILMATHIIADVSLAAERIIVMKNGKIISHGSPQALQEETKTNTLEDAIISQLNSSGDD